MAIKSPPLLGLVLMGGMSSRMGQEKALLRYHQEVQWKSCFYLLQQHCAHVFFSCKVRPLFIEAHCCIEDESNTLLGPIAGILSALKKYPEAAFLVLAIDMPLVDGIALKQLQQERDVGALATAFEVKEGRVEPLCAIYEPSIYPILFAQQEKGPRFILENTPGVKKISLPHPDCLWSVNTPQDRAVFFAKTRVATSRAIGTSFSLESDNP